MVKYCLLSSQIVFILLRDSFIIYSVLLPLLSDIFACCCCGWVNTNLLLKNRIF